jgi:hypothetical protein
MQGPIFLSLYRYDIDFPLSLCNLREINPVVVVSCLDSRKLLLNFGKLLLNFRKLLLTCRKLLLNFHKLLLTCHKLLLNFRKLLLILQVVI